MSSKKNIDAFASHENQANSESMKFDRISLRDYLVEVEIGAFQVERDKTQRVVFDVVVEVVPPVEQLVDDVDRILSYDLLVEAITEELAVERLNLLETLAERIARRILAAPQAIRVFLRIQKLDLGPGALGVEIVRSRGAGKFLEKDDAQLPTQKHILAYFSNAAINSEYLTGWFDQLQKLENPVLICLEPPGTIMPTNIPPKALKRVELLAIEQNAWALAGRENRCLVVSSHAEIEWAARKNRLAVWSPSNIVMNSITDRKAPTNDPVRLAYWMAQLLDADRIYIVGSKEIATDNITVISVALDQAEI